MSDPIPHPTPTSPSALSEPGGVPGKVHQDGSCVGVGLLSLLSPPVAAALLSSPRRPLAGLGTRAGGKRPLPPLLALPQLFPPPHRTQRDSDPGPGVGEGAAVSKAQALWFPLCNVCSCANEARRELVGREGQRPGRPGAFDLTLPQSRGNLATISKVRSIVEEVQAQGLSRSPSAEWESADQARPVPSLASSIRGQEEGGAAQDSVLLSQPAVTPPGPRHTSPAEAWHTARSFSAHTPTSQGGGQGLGARGQVPEVPQRAEDGRAPLSAAESISLRR